MVLNTTTYIIINIFTAIYLNARQTLTVSRPLPVLYTVHHIPIKARGAETLVPHRKAAIADIITTLARFPAIRVTGVIKRGQVTG